MNKASRIVAAINSQPNPFQLRACLFHCTPVSERKKRNHWDPACFSKGSPKRFNQYRRRQTVLGNVKDFTEHLFQKWESTGEEFGQTEGQKHSWFRPNFKDHGHKRGRSRKRAPQSFRSPFEFCADNDDDVDYKFETIRSMFGGNGSFHWSFTMDDGPRWSSSTRSSNYRTSSSWKYEFDEEYEEYTSASQYKKPVNELRSDRLALGLSPSGPLSIEDVKNAYRSCALKWHPDRHQGSSKVGAEEKFKACSAAYQSLCDKMAVH